MLWVDSSSPVHLRATHLLSDLLSYNSVWTFSTGFLIVAYICFSSYSAFGTKLNLLPGPGVARFTRLWLAYTVASKKTNNSYVRLHERYGRTVRTGPYHVSISDPRAIPAIYGFTSDDVKVCEERRL